MTDMIDELEIVLNCPVEECPGEIRTTFGKLKANPEVTCRVCWMKTEVHFTQEELAQARAALASMKGGSTS